MWELHRGTIAWGRRDWGKRLRKASAMSVLLGEKKESNVNIC